MWGKLDFGHGTLYRILDAGHGVLDGIQHRTTSVPRRVQLSMTDDP
jgi:hypothetical protein